MLPYTSVEAITKSDTNTVRPTSALYVGGLGDLAVVMGGSGRTTAVFTAVAAGTLLPINVSQVLATGTTATLILALR